MDLYIKKPSQAENIAIFRKLMDRYHWAEWKQPNAEKSPWHVQCIIRGEGPYPALINFWPHVAKAQRDGCIVVQEWDNVRTVISQAIEENGYGDGVELVE